MPSETYTEYAPHPILSQYVACYWVKRQQDVSATYRILPDACMDIIFDFSAQQERLYLVGTSTSYFDKTIYGTADYFGIRFKPGGIYPFIAQPLDQFTDDTILLEDLSAKLYHELKQNIRRELNDGERIRQADKFLLKIIASKTKFITNNNIHSTINHIIESKGLITVKNLVNRACVSERQLQRKFLELVGVSPKALCSIVRFIHIQAFIKRYPGMGVEELAFEGGYFDHSHLYKEFMKFSGITPKG